MSKVNRAQEDPLLTLPRDRRSQWYRRRCHSLCHLELPCLRKRTPNPFLLRDMRETISDRGNLFVGVIASQLRGRTAHSRHHRHQQRRRTRMSQVLLRRCIRSSRTVQHHRRCQSQQTLIRNSPDCPQESADGTEPTPSTGRSVETLTASSSKPTSAPNRKGGPKVDVFLASLQTTGSQPSLEDLEHHRPREFAHPDSILYAKQYNEVMEHLDRSFTKEQLRLFGEKYRLDPRLWKSHRRKVDYARAIVESAWGWPSLRDAEKRRREKTEVVTESKQ